MSELGDVEFRGETEAAAEPQPPQDERPRRGPWVWVAVVVLVVLAAGAAYYFFIRPGKKASEPATTPTPTVAAGEPEPAGESAAGPDVELPPLGESDSMVAALARELSSHPRLAAWLLTDDLVRRFVASVDNLARGESPRTHLLFMDPDAPFRIDEEGERLTVDPGSYRRYDLATEVFTSLDTEGTARLYHRLEPLLDEAYRELGYPRADFDATLARAIDRLLATPVVEGEVELTPGVTTYDYADPALETLPPAQKQLLRMGPGNVRRVKAKLRELRDAFGLPRG